MMNLLITLSSSLYEGYVSQLSGAYVACTMISTGWKAPWMNQLLIYVYSILRIRSTFNHVPSITWIVFANASLLFTLWSYCYWKSLKSEFLAIHLQKQSASHFKNTCLAISEGVLIIDSESSELDFMNPKMKNLFNLNQYIESNKEVEKLKELQNSIDNQFEVIKSKLSSGIQICTKEAELDKYVQMISVWEQADQKGKIINSGLLS